jgi:hypothetical protein
LLSTRKTRGNGKGEFFLREKLKEKERVTAVTRKTKGE